MCYNSEGIGGRKRQKNCSPVGPKPFMLKWETSKYYWFSKRKLLFEYILIYFNLLIDFGGSFQDFYIPAQINLQWLKYN